MTGPLPLPTLLSSALVAFTIEFDNEAEKQMEHRTSADEGLVRADGPWLTSQVMWANILQHIGREGCTVAELHARARTTHDSLSGLARWGYVRVTPGGQPSRGGRPGGDAVVHLTAGGREAQRVWEPLAAQIEARWSERFGIPAIERLRGSLLTVLGRIELALPRYVPVIYPTQNGRAEHFGGRRLPDDTITDADHDLSVLLSQVLLAFTVDFEKVSKISLPISLTSLRVLTAYGVQVRDLPGLTGVSPEGNRMCTGFLSHVGCVVVEPVPGAARGRQVRLTLKGQQAQTKFRRVLSETEADWHATFGADGFSNLRQALIAVVGDDTTAATSPLFAGLTPPPEGWRAKVRPPDRLPHYPMVLHRGGYPDGS